MKIKTQSAEGQRRESTQSHSWDRRWRRIENWIRKSYTECRAGGRTGIKCGVLCDRKIKGNINGKVYRTAVRPALVYMAETCALKKAHGKQMEAAEMRMLRAELPRRTR